MKAGTNPRDAKIRLATEIVKLYRGEKEAEVAKENFIKVFSQKEKPEQVESYKVKSEKLIDVLVEINFAPSRSEAKRLIEQGGVKIDDKVISDINFSLASGEHLVQKGKRFFAKVIIQ